MFILMPMFNRKHFKRDFKMTLCVYFAFLKGNRNFR